MSDLSKIRSASPNDSEAMLLPDLVIKVDTGLGEKASMLPEKGEEKMKEALYETETISVKSSTSRPLLDRLGFFLVPAAFITCLIATALTIAIMVQSRQTEQPLENPQQIFSHPVCLQCIKLIKNPFNHMEADHLVDKLNKRVVNGVQMCCAEDKEQMSALLEAGLREQVTRPIPAPGMLSSNLKFIPASAHKQLLPNDELESNLTEPLISNGSKHFLARFNKDYQDPLTEHVRGVTVQDTSLKIQHTGIYYVYLSVHMAKKFNKPVTRFTFQTWSQYIHRESPNNPADSGILLHTAHTVCLNCNQHEETAFIGGTFHLKKNDNIEVCLSGLGLVRYKKESTYLGLIMLSSERAT